MRTSKKRTSTRYLWIALAAAVLLLAACAVLFARTKVRLNGTAVSVNETSVSVPEADESTMKQLSRMKHLESLNLENALDDAKTIRMLNDLLPGCSISFKANLSKGTVGSDAECVTVYGTDDFRWLPYLKQLKSVLLDPETLPADESFIRNALSFIAENPGTELIFEDGSEEGFLLNPAESQNDCSELSADQIGFIVPFLPPGASVLLPNLISEKELSGLIEGYPEITFLFRDEPPVMETVVITEETDTETLLQNLSSFGNLETVDLSTVKTDWEQVASVSEHYPEAEILFRTEVFGKELTSETELLVLDGIRIEDLSPIERILPAARSLRQIDMCGCGVPDEEMVAFRDRNPDRKIVWTVDLKHWTLRTDITHFATWKVKTDEEGYIVSARNIGGNTSKSLAPLQYCTDLVALDLGHNKITDLSFLSGLTNLKYLIIALNEVTDLSPLSGLSELKYLEIFSNENITDISPLAGLKKLEALCMSDTKVTDISPLYGNQALRRLYLQGYRFDKEARAEIAEKLPDCTVLYKTLGSTGSDWRQCDYYPEMRKALGWKID